MTDVQTALQENQGLAAELIQAENKVLRESIDYLTRYVDPRGALEGPDGTLWPEVGSLAGEGTGASIAFTNEQQLADARNAGRSLERTNEFAINGHENRISYIVGTGHTYKVVVRRGAQTSADLVDETQAVLDQFIQINRWQHRQQEIVRRQDRDGEVFLRTFIGHDGVTRVRFVEPSQIYRPTELGNDPAASFGIVTEPGDVETVLGYWVDGQEIDAAEIQHRKIGVDSNVKRGIPLFFPVRKNLLRAEKLLHNMATVADIQTAIAMIRRHDRATKSTAETFRSGTANLTLSNSATGDTTFFKHYPPGTILDTPKSTEYEFPAAGLDASRYVLVLGAILRSVAARLVFPEFMLTADASNANYSSTLVAEGPAVKMFQRWQADMEVDDLEVMWKVIDAAARAGRLPSDVRELVEVQVGKPRVATRDQKQEAEVNDIYHRMGIKSRQTIAAEIGLDHSQEQENYRQESSSESSEGLDTTIAQ